VPQLHQRHDYFLPDNARPPTKIGVLNFSFIFPISLFPDGMSSVNVIDTQKPISA